ncbi:MAG: hypothetical protein ACOX6T_04805 [Myxococcales bacterium]
MTRRTPTLLQFAPPLLLASVLGCSSAQAAAARPPDSRTYLERALLEDAADRRFEQLGSLDAALIAGGAIHPAELTRTREDLLARITAVVKTLPREPAAAGRALLRALHEGSHKRPALLRSYDPEATSLLDILDTGRFNCVSATVLYLLAAERAGLVAHPVLMPSHARAELQITSRATVTVETTSPRGFDPPPATQAQLAARMRPENPGNAVDLYSNEKGTRVDLPALLGATYLNRAIQARARGALATVEALERMAEPLATRQAASVLRQVRASTLSELAMNQLSKGKTLDALALFEEAARLAKGTPQEPIFLQNLIAVAQRHLQKLAAAGDEKPLLQFPDRFAAWPEVRREVASFAYQAAALRRGKLGDHRGMADLLREAAALGGRGEASARRNLELAEHNAKAQRFNESIAKLERLRELGSRDPSAAWAQLASVRTFDAPELERSRRELGVYLAARRAEEALDAQDGCAKLDAAVDDWIALLDKPSIEPARMRAACRSKVGNRAFAAGRVSEALRWHREAHRLFPGDPVHARNLAACLGTLAKAKVQAGRCRDALPLLDKARKLAPQDPGILQLLRACSR